MTVSLRKMVIIVNYRVELLIIKYKGKGNLVIYWWSVYRETKLQ